MKTHILILGIILFINRLSGQSGHYLEYVQRNGDLPLLKFEVFDCKLGNITTNYIEINNMQVRKLVFLTKKGGSDMVYKLDREKGSYSEVPPNSDPKKNSFQIIGLDDEPVAGYDCKHAKIVENDFENNGLHVYEVWLTKGIPNYNNYNDAFNHAHGLGSPSRLKVLKEAGYEGLPVRTIHTSKGVSSVIELSKFEERVCDETSFMIPLNYTLVPFELNPED